MWSDRLRTSPALFASVFGVQKGYMIQPGRGVGMKLGMRLLTALAIACATGTTAYADEVTDWNQVFLEANVAAGTNPIFSSRFAAIVQTAVFDAVNGIERKYSPIHVPL